MVILVCSQFYFAAVLAAVVLAAVVFNMLCVSDTPALFYLQV